MPPRPMRSAAVAAICVLALFGCGDDPIDPGDGQPAVASVVIHPAEVPLLTEAGDTFRLVAQALDSYGDPIEHAVIDWLSRDAGVVTVAAGLVTAIGGGATYVAASSGGASDSVRVEVEPGSAATALRILAPETARQGDVVQLEAVVTWRAGGEDTLRAGASWSLQPAGAGLLLEDGRLVAYTPSGTITVAATAGGLAHSATIAVQPRGLGGSFVVVDNANIDTRNTTDLWAHGSVVYTGTFPTSLPGNRMYVWDIAAPSAITLADSVAVAARQVNDVKIRADGTLAVLTHEGSADGLNGITLLDLADPLHPQVITRYTGDCASPANPSCLSGGVHNVWIEGQYVYAVEPAGGVHVIDVANPASPFEVALYHAGASFPHDVLVREGLAFVSHWNAGMIILDVGHGVRGGSPTSPVEVSRIALPAGSVHNVWYWPEAGYAFVGHEQFAEPVGGMSVVDVSDLAAPVLVAEFFLPGSPPHNFWLDEARGILFAAWYSNGLRAIDVTGELLGELHRQGREFAAFDSAVAGGAVSIWAPQLHDGLVYASDILNGLWALQFTASP
jgi:hypothetical protein